MAGVDRGRGSTAAVVAEATGKTTFQNFKKEREKMSIDADREGTFRARIINSGVTAETSGAVAIIVECLLTEFWDTETQQWTPWEEYDMYADGRLYVVKKDRTENTTQIEPLIRDAGWNGSLADVAGNRVAWRPIQVSIKADTYQGVTRYRVNFISDYDRQPGGLGAIDEPAAKQLDGIYGGKFRALAGTYQHGRVAPVGRPVAPVRPVMPARPPMVQNAAQQPQTHAPRRPAPGAHAVRSTAYPDPNAVDSQPPFADEDPTQYDEQGNRIPY